MEAATSFWSFWTFFGKALEGLTGEGCWFKTGRHRFSFFFSFFSVLPVPGYWWLALLLHGHP